MSRYEYICQDCGYAFEHQVDLGDDGLADVTCPLCYSFGVKKKPERLLSRISTGTFQPEAAPDPACEDGT